jgi:phage shock protein A
MPKGTMQTMGLFHRLGNLLSANLNDLLDQAENPERLLRQAVRELETGLGRLLDAAARAIAHERLLAREHAACRERVAGAHERAAAAVERGDDAAARRELRFKAQHQRDAALLAEQLARAADTSGRLKGQVAAMRSKLAEARGKLGDLSARHRAAVARRKLAASLRDGLLEPTAGCRFERFAARIERDEAETEALFELLGEVDTAADDADRDAALEAELLALKEQRHAAG